MSSYIAHEISYHLESSGPTLSSLRSHPHIFVTRFSLESKSITVCISPLYRDTKEPLLAFENLLF